MKKVASILSLALLAGVAAYVSAEDQPASQPTSEPSSAPATQASAENGAVNQFCAIEKENKIDPKGKTYTYNGKTVGFCCPDCIDEFKKNPEKYMATLK
jgi:YHS domain-containing protein